MHTIFFSGYAEMLKHGLISNTAHWVELLNFNTSNIDYTALKQLVGQSVQVKEDIVEQDPFEHGIRKALNLGHTVDMHSKAWHWQRTALYCMDMQ